VKDVVSDLLGRCINGARIKLPTLLAKNDLVGTVDMDGPRDNEVCKTTSAELQGFTTKVNSDNRIRVQNANHIQTHTFNSKSF
jgi:hypothetical protein